MARGGSLEKRRPRRGAQTSTRGGPRSSRPKTVDGPTQHRHEAQRAVGPVGVAVITVSSTRSEADDDSGAELKRLFEGAGHKVAFYRVVPDRVRTIQRAVREALAVEGVDLVITNGGTGMGRKDVTLEAVEPLLEKRADGWGDVFRSVSRREVGTAVFLSRSVAGTVGKRWVVCVPGSPAAVRTAARRMLLPELEHMVWEVRR